MPDYPNPSSQQAAQLLGSGFGSDLRKRFDIRSSLRGAVPLRTPGSSDMQWPGGSAPIASGMGFFPGSTVPLNFPFLPSLFTIGGGGGGGGGSVTISQGAGITVSPNGVPASSFTIAGAYTASNGAQLVGVDIQHAMTAGANVSSITAGGVVNVTDMRPTAGTDIGVSGTQVDWDPRILWGLCLVNATVDLTSGPPYVISTGVAAVNAYGSPFNYYKWRYKCVPIQLTGVVNTGTGAWSIAYDNSDSRLNAGLSGASAYRAMWNKNEYGNVTNWVDPGVFVGTGGAYPTNFNPMPLGYDQNAGTWRTIIRPFMRYRVSGTTYEWLIADPQAHDGTCDATDAGGSPQDGFWQ